MRFAIAVLIALGLVGNAWAQPKAAPGEAGRGDALGSLRDPGPGLV